MLERIRPRRSSVLTVPAVLLLLAAAGLGCGASQGATTTTGTGRVPDPVQLAAAINRSQAVIDGSSRRGVQRAALAQQLAFRQLAAHRYLRRPTLTRLTPAARSAATAALRAASALSQIVPAERSFPSWRIVAPPPPRKLLRLFETAARTY